MLFEILKPLDAQLLSLTNRSEKHGEEDVPAISAWFEVETSATILDMLGDGQIRHAIFYGDDKQSDVPGVVKTTPHLRTKRIARVTIDQQPLEGWRLKVDHGIDEHDPVAFGSCKVDGFSFEPKDHQIVLLKFRVGTSDIDAESLGIMGMKVGQRVTIASLTAPKVKPKEQPTDKGAPLFEGAEDKPAAPRKPAAAERAAVAKVKGGKVPPDQVVKYRDPATGSAWSGRGLQPAWIKAALAKGKKLSDFEAGAQKRVPQGTDAWPFPIGARPSTEKPPQSVTIERSQPGTRTARGREATKAFIDAHGSAKS